MRPLLAMLLVACTTEPAPVEPEPLCPLHDALTAELEPALAETDAPGAVIAVHSRKSGPCAVAAGMANVDAATAMTPQHLFEVASVTKTFTAAVVLQLRDEGRLSLDDPLSAFYPDVSYAPDVTVEHLLRHTSGIEDHMLTSEILSGLGRPWTPEELVAIDDTLRFPPGSDWYYSNTNYILLGLVIEEVTGNTWEAEVRARLLDPLELRSTWLPTVEVLPDPSALARGYFGSVDSTGTIHPSLGWSAGSMISSAEDLLRWLDALLGGEVLSPSTLTEMSTVAPVRTDYGLGIYVLEDGEKRGHDGDAVHYQTHAFHTADGAVVALLNSHRPRNVHPPWIEIVEDAGWRVLDAE